MGATKTINIIAVTLSVLLAIGLFISNIIFSFKYHEYQLDTNPILLVLEENFNSKLIYNLELKESCENGEEKLTLGRWDGTIEGCYCYYDNIKRGSCSKSDYNNKCETLQGYPPLDYYKINSKFICVKNSKETYKSLLKTDQVVPKDSECPQNYTSCGILDTIGNKFCVENGGKCPINMEYINNITSYSNLQNEYESFPIGYAFNGNSFAINNEVKTILSVFKISENQPCINQTEKYWTYNYILGPLNKKCSPINSKLYDDRFKQILNTMFDTKKNDLYKDNSIPEITITESDNIIVHTYARNLLGFNKNKIYDFSIDKIKSTEDLSNNCASVMKILSYILLGFLSLPVIGFIGACTTHRHGRSDCTPEQCGCACMTGIVGAGITAVLAFLIDFILCIIIFVCALRLKLYLNIKESDVFTNEMIQILIDEGSKNFLFSLAIVILIALLIIQGIILLVNFIINQKIEL